MSNRLVDASKIIKKSKSAVKSSQNALAYPGYSPEEAKRRSMEEKKWRTEEAIRTLTRAEEIRKDKSLMRDVEKSAKEKMLELKKIC